MSDLAKIVLGVAVLGMALRAQENPSSPPESAPAAQTPAEAGTPIDVRPADPALAWREARPAADPTSLPFPELLDPVALQNWFVNTRDLITQRIMKSREAGDRAEVARQILLLERVRAHTVVLLKKLRAQAEAGARAAPAT